MGKWEVDGKLESIADQSLARAILTKVNNMNVETGLTCVAASAVFAILPQSTSIPLVLIAALYTGTYFLSLCL